MPETFVDDNIVSLQKFRRDALDRAAPSGNPSTHINRADICDRPIRSGSIAELKAAYFRGKELMQVHDCNYEVIHRLRAIESDIVRCLANTQSQSLSDLELKSIVALDECAYDPDPLILSVLKDILRLSNM